LIARRRHSELLVEQRQDSFTQSREALLPSRQQNETSVDACFPQLTELVGDLLGTAGNRKPSPPHNELLAQLLQFSGPE
jgi:hypothetical protein